MFQTFDEKSDPSTVKPRVEALRSHMESEGLDAFLVPHSDEHQNEYLPARAERLAWLTGFTGSAGMAIVLRNSAHLFVDGRYTLQAAAQTDSDVFSRHSLIDTPPDEWLAENLTKGSRVGFDPWLHTFADVTKLKKACAEGEAELVPVSRNPVDAIRNDLPPPPLGQVTLHPMQFAGETARDKIGRITDAVRDREADAVILTDPASLCWLFNVRGSDVAHTPLVLGFAIVPVEGEPEIFIDKRKLAIKSEAYLAQLGALRPPEDFEQALEALGRDNRRVMVDPALSAQRIVTLLEQAGASVVKSPDPVRIPRARKNAAELSGARAAHRRDGAAMAAFLAWVDAQPPGSLDEITAATTLEDARRETGERLGMPLADISFDTISGAGPNGAIVHYRVTTKTNRVAGDGELLLIDSGGQYQDGTTDITRVIPIGVPGERYRRHFTLVLKGMIAISLARFPEGTRGVDIDVLARNALWQAGLDYAHGTGHGVGSYLSVHEGPQNISRRGTQALLPGMIVSNEPGYYETGSHGIRIENLVVVTPAEIPEGGATAMHGFETLTLCPIDRRLIDPGLLTAAEIGWLDAYHARVREEVSPLVDDPDVRAWLEKMTAPL
ncbi:aminopeptidase P family protein [Oricola cellulosilytica]|uniref:Aminopeptidase P family protein n=1 Tax=Oricola cellulosilytica TaxID=1429082 RepID=A0A4V2MNY1_9HYPH|nr:aminopeptidase P family protein [Oricola cellulosilytica]TCD15227.1 aminopeptidase P family protein [Oricola cellulosilytica]